MAMQVQDVMTSPAITVSPSTPIKEAVELMDSKRIGALPVVDGAGRPTGIIAGADVVRRSSQERGPSKEKDANEVASIMTTHVRVVDREMPVRYAARVMEEKGIGRLPVVGEHGEVIGIVARRDVLKMFLRSDSDLAAEIEAILEAWEHQGRGHELGANVDKGRAELSGVARTRTLAESLGVTVAAIDGLVAVVNRLTYDVDDTTLIAVGRHEPAGVKR